MFPILFASGRFIGKHRLTSARAPVQEIYSEVRFQFNWLPYFLTPTRRSGASLTAHFSKPSLTGTAGKKLQHAVDVAGREAYVHFNFEHIVIRPTTMSAHRLSYSAQSIGHRSKEAEALVERLFIAHFQRGEDIGKIGKIGKIDESAK